MINTVTISLEEYNGLIKSQEALNKLEKEDAVIELSWYNGWAKYYPKEKLNAIIREKAESEIKRQKKLKTVLDKLATKSIFGFLKFKRTYNYTS